MRTLRLALDDSVASELDRVAAALSKDSETFAADLVSHSVAGSTASLIEIMTLATESFGSIDRAYGWILTPNFTLGNKAPAQMLGDDDGRRLVRAVLLRLEHGVYS
ncbi:MAG: antitoxin Xre/MbcA/ParS toxin-binding domain-containing protein [Dehalococcoidia bacterium]